MAVTSSTETTYNRDGKQYTTFIVIQDDTTLVADEFSLKFPQVGTITLLEADLTGTPGASTIRPAFGTVTAFVVDEDGFVDQASAAASHHFIDQNKRVVPRPVGDALFGELFYRSTPDVNLTAGQTIVTRITVAWGQYVG